MGYTIPDQTLEKILYKFRKVPISSIALLTKRTATTEGLEISRAGGKVIIFYRENEGQREAQRDIFYLFQGSQRKIIIDMQGHYTLIDDTKIKKSGLYMPFCEKLEKINRYWRRQQEIKAGKQSTLYDF